MKILETERLILRRFVPADVDALAALYGDPEVRRYFPEGTLTYEQTREELEWFIKGHPHQPELGLWATLHKPSGSFIGRCGLLPWTIEGRPEVEVAYLLYKDYWGQGLGTEVAAGILRYAFEVLGLTRVICLIDPENFASRKVAEKIGMRLQKSVEGIEGDGFPTLIYAATKPDAVLGGSHPRL